MSKLNDFQETLTYNFDRASPRRVRDKARVASGEVRGSWHQSWLELEVPAELFWADNNTATVRHSKRSMA